MQDFTKELKSVVNPKLQKELGIKNLMSIPKIEKIIVNVGIGSRLKNTKDFSDVVDNIAAITGQKPIVTYAKQAISNFKLREGTPNGIKTTLRRHKMLDFFNRMVNVAFPRIRDFQGFSDKSFDNRGNYSIGIKDCSIFPEVNPDDLAHIHGMSITIVTSAKDNENAKALLSALNFPFKKAPKVEEKEEESEERKELGSEAPTPDKEGGESDSEKGGGPQEEAKSDSDLSSEAGGDKGEEAKEEKEEDPKEPAPKK